MSRVINTDGPGKMRNQIMRTAAEVIRHLGLKSEIDDDARNMAAYLVFCFREIDEGIDDTVRAWERRDYWVKAEKFRLRWAWAGQAALELQEVIYQDDWDRMPHVLVRLLPNFEDVKIARFTRSPSLWQNAYDRLLSEQARERHSH